jgi:2-polyprenyl-6-methoxyphenol hydroxylase-like FAD-dependent oxidoreductase
VPRIIIVGAGPAGAALAYLLARREIDVVLLERQHDFAREFRGEVLMPSGMDALQQMGLGAALARVPMRVPSAVEIYVDRRRLMRIDLDRARFGDQPPAACSQPALLETIVAEASRHPSLQFERGATVRDLLHADGRISGVRVERADGAHELRADLVIGADGRSSVVRRRAALAAETSPVMFDVVWCKLPLPSAYGDDSPARGYLADGHLLLAGRSFDDRLQVAWVIMKGTFGELKRRGIAQWVEEMAAHVSPDLSAHFRAVAADVVHPFLLDVASDRVHTWSRPGVLVIGDAAHTMSPVGAQGLNIALRDAIVAANHLVPACRQGGGEAALDAACQRIERERVHEVATVQRLQALPPPLILARSLLASVVRQVIPRFLGTRFGLALAARQARVVAYGVDPVRLAV